jgi:hypothetical protein
MLSQQQFSTLSYQDKKKTLIEIMEQISTKGVSFADTIFLINASNAIQEATLVSIYQSLTSLVNTSKEIWVTNEELVQMKEQIQHDISSQSEKKEADDLLDTI